MVLVPHPGPGFGKHGTTDQAVRLATAETGLQPDDRLLAGQQSSEVVVKSISVVWVLSSFSLPRGHHHHG